MTFYKDFLGTHDYRKLTMHSKERRPDLDVQDCVSFPQWGIHQTSSKDWNHARLNTRIPLSNKNFLKYNFKLVFLHYSSHKSLSTLCTPSTCHTLLESLVSNILKLSYCDRLWSPVRVQERPYVHGEQWRGKTVRARMGGGRGGEVGGKWKIFLMKTVQICEMSSLKSDKAAATAIQ